MKVISGARGTGKTKRLIEEASTMNGTIVCKYPEKMLEKIFYYGYRGVQVIGYDQYLSNTDTASSNYLIDEIEDFLSFLSNDHGKVSALTINL